MDFIEIFEKCHLNIQTPEESTANVAAAAKFRLDSTVPSSSSDSSNTWVGFVDRDSFESSAL